MPEAVAPAIPAVSQPLRRRAPSWFDVLLVLFLVGLAALPPVNNTEGLHKFLILAAFGLLQVFEARIVRHWPRGGPIAVVLAKIVLSSLLIWHSTVNGETAINSSYYEIYYLPIITAAIYFGPIGALASTALASSAYLSFLWPAIVYQHRDLTEDAGANLALRVLFFFIAGVVVNRIVLEMRRQRERYRDVATALEVSNAQLRLAQEEARRSERLAALGQLSAGLAHEIRNPLSVIKGSAEMLEKNPASPLAAELAGYISSEVNRVNDLVTRFLDFARPLRLERSRQRLDPLLDQAIESVRARLPDAAVVVTRDIAPALPELSLDATLFERVLENLVSNAFEAMEPAGGALRVAAAPATEQGRPGVAILIEDSGPGVPDGLREQIFNPFFTTKKTGVGLGLAIVSKIVDDHGGAVRLQASPSGGACFRIFLPQASESTGP